MVGERVYQLADLKDDLKETIQADMWEIGSAVLMVGLSDNNTAALSVDMTGIQSAAETADLLDMKLKIPGLEWWQKLLLV